MKIFLLGAAGNERILRAALARAHDVTAMVRDEAKLPSSPNLRVTRGIVDKSLDLVRVMAGHDVVINAAGNVAEASAFTKLVQTVIDATTASLGEGGRLWVFGGAARRPGPRCGRHLLAATRPRGRTYCRAAPWAFIDAARWTFNEFRSTATNDEHGSMTLL